MSEASVTIYGTSWCVWCPRAKAHFDKEGIAYKYYDVESDEAGHKELVEKLGGPVQGVPVLDVNGTIIVGYDVGKINAALAK